MAEEQAEGHAEGHAPHHETGEKQSPEEAWQEVGRQIEALSDSLAHAFRAAWEREETQSHVRSVEKGLEKVADDIDRAVSEAGESQQARRIRTEARRTAGSLRQAGEKTWEDVRPRVLSGLRQVEDRLNALIENLEREAEDQEAAPNQGRTEE